MFFRSAKKAELEENQRSYKQKKKRRRIKVQEDSSSENKVIMRFTVSWVITGKVHHSSYVIISSAVYSSVKFYWFIYIFPFSGRIDLLNI